MCFKFFGCICARDYLGEGFASPLLLLSLCCIYPIILSEAMWQSVYCNDVVVEVTMWRTTKLWFASFTFFRRHRSSRILPEAFEIERSLAFLHIHSAFDFVFVMNCAENFRTHLRCNVRYEIELEDNPPKHHRPHNGIQSVLRDHCRHLLRAHLTLPYLVTGSI